MIVKETVDRELIDTVLKCPAIYETITSDNCPNASDMEFPINQNYKYIGGFVNGEIVALMVYHSYKGGNECHVQVLPKFRKQYAKEFGEKSLLFKGNLPLYAEIPELYENVIAFAKLNNFEVIGKHKDNYVKGGIEHPVCILKYKG